MSEALETQHAPLRSIDTAARRAMSALNDLGDSLAQYPPQAREIHVYYEREIEKAYRRVRIMLGDE